MTASEVITIYKAGLVLHHPEPLERAIDEDQVYKQVWEQDGVECSRQISVGKEWFAT